MSRKLRPVVFTPVALGDVEDLAEYVREEDPEAADELLDRLLAAGESLAQFPLRGRIPPELRDTETDEYRELLLPPWRLLYRVHLERIVILGVFDGRRNLEDVLLRRVLRSPLRQP